MDRADAGNPGRAARAGVGTGVGQISVLVTEWFADRIQIEAGPTKSMAWRAFNRSCMVRRDPGLVQHETQHDFRKTHAKSLICGRSSMVERQLPKLHTRVRFPSPAPIRRYRTVTLTFPILSSENPKTASSVGKMVFITLPVITI